MANQHYGIDIYRVRSAIDLFNTLNKMTMGATVVFNDTDIANISTGVAGLKGLVSNAINNSKIHISEVPICRAALEAIEEMEGLGELTDSNVNGAANYAALLALISDAAPAGDDTDKHRGGWVYSGNVAKETFVG